MDIEGADVLPAKLIEDEFKDQYGQPLNFARVEKSRHTIDNWYRDRYLDGMVCIHVQNLAPFWRQEKPSLQG